MEELIRMISMALVDAPADVHITRFKNTNGLPIYEIKAAKADTGKIIGRQGRNAAALRTIVNAVSRKKNERVMVEIL